MGVQGGTMGRAGMPREHQEGTLNLGWALRGLREGFWGKRASGSNILKDEARGKVF